MSETMVWEITVPTTEQAKKVENFLKKRFPIGYVRKLFRKDGVRINGKRSGPGMMACPGDRIQLYIPFEQSVASRDKSIPLRPAFETVFEDDDILVINKQAGLAVHEGKNILKRHSLLGMLEAAYRPRGIIPKLVHRTDRETSGLLIVAKKESMAEELQKLFEEGGVEKEYMALVAGTPRPKQGRIEKPLPGRAGSLVAAVTLYRVEKEFSGASLVRVKIRTGRMHQIRLHFAGLGHPVVMDDRHGDFAFNKQFRKAYGLKRQFLHASAISLEYRGTKRRWSAPLPEDLLRALDSLQGRHERRD